MTKIIIWTTALTTLAAILQSTLLSPLAVHFYAKPDIALDILVFSAYMNGMMTGQLCGFFSGLMLDFLSNAPLGLNLFVRTVTGALSGLLNGAFLLDKVFLPAALCAGATALKAGLLFLLNRLFAGAIPAYSLNTPTLWVELAMNVVLAPLVFAMMNMLSRLIAGRKS
ncbi:MAG: rod shape-determining protein MreD [Spirochaetaceae bacterium]|jgi:rod shape-determining protein MreD|nr:rod shape-determining protein MreD [Spirochaetaceae bacterium]